MNRTFLPAPPFLSDYVDSIFVFENSANTNGFCLPLFANGKPTIVFQTTGASKQHQSVGHLTLYGQTVRPDTLHFDTGFTMIAYFMHPHSLTSLFGIDAAELTDHHLDLNELKTTKRVRLQEQLLNETALAGRLRLMNQFILKLAETRSDEYAGVFYITDKLKEMNVPVSLTDIRKELDITERSLQRLFAKNVGISPRLYKRVCQFDAAFQQLNRNRFTKLVDIVYQHGFSDQSHFTRVFKEFTGLTPTDYLKSGDKLTQTEELAG